MGPKFAIVFSGIETNTVADFMKDMKQRIESLEIPKAGENPDETEEFATPIINVVLSTYYKGTALDGVTKKLEEYLDSANPKENDINNL